MLKIFVPFLKIDMFLGRPEDEWRTVGCTEAEQSIPEGALFFGVRY